MRRGAAQATAGCATDGDRILAVVRAPLQFGWSNTYDLDTVAGRAGRGVRGRLGGGGVDASTIGMVEAHGTGTPVGDPIEFASLAQIYGRAGKRCLLGSAKSNFGHTSPQRVHWD